MDAFDLFGTRSRRTGRFSTRMESRSPQCSREMPRWRSTGRISSSPGRRLGRRRCVLRARGSGRDRPRHARGSGRDRAGRPTLGAAGVRRDELPPRVEDDRGGDWDVVRRTRDSERGGSRPGRSPRSRTPRSSRRRLRRPTAAAPPPASRPTCRRRAAAPPPPPLRRRPRYHRRLHLRHLRRRRPRLRHRRPHRRACGASSRASWAGRSPSREPASGTRTAPSAASTAFAPGGGPGAALSRSHRAQARSGPAGTRCGWPWGVASERSNLVKTSDPAAVSATVPRGHAPPNPHRGSSYGSRRSCCCAGTRLLHAGADARRDLLAAGPVHGSRAGGDPRRDGAEARRALPAEADPRERHRDRPPARHPDGEVRLGPGDGRGHERRPLQLERRPPERDGHAGRRAQGAPASRPLEHRRHEHGDAHGSARGPVRLLAGPRQPPDSQPEQDSCGGRHGDLHAVLGRADACRAGRGRDDPRAVPARRPRRRADRYRDRAVERRRHDDPARRRRADGHRLAGIEARGRDASGDGRADPVFPHAELARARRGRRARRRADHRSQRPRGLDRRRGFPAGAARAAQPADRDRPAPRRHARDGRRRRPSPRVQRGPHQLGAGADARPARLRDGVRARLRGLEHAGVRRWSPEPALRPGRGAGRQGDARVDVHGRLRARAGASGALAERRRPGRDARPCRTRSSARLPSTRS